MKREAIPANIAAKVLFESDRTCCVCRTKGKPVQIHHIDGDRSNNSIQNLAILCLDCHTGTQVTGGFHRKLDAEQIVLYRDDWILEVLRQRSITIYMSKEDSISPNIELVTSTIESLRENEQYELVAMEYNHIGNSDLRDKYIELALKKQCHPQSEIYLRHMQGRIKDVKQSTINKEVKRMTKNKDWSQLARLFVQIGNAEKAIESYCKAICEDLKDGNMFAAAFYLKELTESELHSELFEKAYGYFSEKGDLWWQVRSLQELGWDTELKELLVSKQSEIEESGDPMLLMLLYRVQGEKEKLYEVNKQLAESMRVSIMGEDIN